MGIKDFLKIVVDGKPIRDYGHVFTDDTSSVSNFAKFITGRKIAVDAFNIIYRARHAIGDSLSSNGKTTSHIKIILNTVMRFVKLGVMQIWVFDGGYNKLKAECLEKRTNRISKEEIEDIKKLLEYCGVPYFIVGVEAEFFAAEMVKKNMVEYVLSSDMDVIVKGGNIIKDEKKNGKKQYFIMKSSEFMEKTNLALEDLAKIGVVMGSDFAPKTPRIGPGSVMKKYKDIELTERQNQAYELFLKPLGSCILSHSKGQFDADKLKEFLKNLDFSEKSIDSAIRVLGV